MSFAPKGSAPRLSEAAAAVPAAASGSTKAPAQPAPAAPGAPAPASPKPASSSDAGLRRPTNYLVGAYDSRVLQDACTAMQGAESEASRLAQAHLDSVLQVGAAASEAVADSATASQVTTAALAALATQTGELKLGFNNGAGCCG
jgi:hypothetical protein